MPGCVAAYCSDTALDFWPRYLTSTSIDALPSSSYGTTQMTCVLLTYVSGAATPPGWKITCTPPNVVGMFVHGAGHVVPSSFTAVAGPMGLAGLAKIASISPGETGPVTKLAAFVTSVM